jgi:hypothetical protein
MSHILILKMFEFLYGQIKIKVKQNTSKNLRNNEVLDLSQTHWNVLYLIRPHSTDG